MVVSAYVKHATKILLVEDFIGDAKGVIRSLEYNEPGDLDITWVNRLQEAISMLSKKIYDVILLDLSLPDAKEIKAVIEIRRFFRDIPIIVMSDMTDDKTVKRVLNSGATKFLAKTGLNGKLILKSIRQALSKSDN